MKLLQKKCFFHVRANINEIAYAVNICRKKGIRPILLMGFKLSYRTKRRKFFKFSLIKETFKKHADFGYQDYSSGSSQYHKLLPFFACGIGATFWKNILHLIVKELIIILP